ncbi:mitochondrial fusion and transport protein Ugo1 [Annulohypoxylon moriforme]|nr:mitochondrial fusion and transport protein Ugo1 [Annulohypoxylon moriforme]
MSSTREGVNPLRPYYIPPSIGEQQVGTLPPQPNPFSHGNVTTPTPTAPNKYASRARDIFPDIDYKDHLDDLSPSAVQSVKQFIDELLWKYTSVLMSQPFEVAKTVLQVRIQDDLGNLNAPEATKAPRRPSPGLMSPTSLGSPDLDSPNPLNPKRSVWDEGNESDSEPEESAYFTSSTPYTPTPSTRSHRRRGSSPLGSPKPAPKPEVMPHQLVLRRPDSIFDVISQLWSKESAWGVWKGTNATFLYTVLQSLFENWSRSLLSALLNVPDLGLKDDVDRLVDVASPYPWASLCVAAAAAVATGLILAPLDLVRTRLIVIPTGRSSRRTLATLRALPSWVCPTSLIAPTMLNSLVHPFFTLSTPLVLRSQFLIDREQSPMTFSIAKFCASCASLFIKLPLETVLRRGQVAVLAEPTYLDALDETGQMDTIVPPGPYNGVVSTMYSIVTEEGSRAVAAKIKAPPRGRKLKSPKAADVIYRRGQGLDGLWRGWKVSWWGLVGLWTAGVAGGGGEGEF